MTINGEGRVGYAVAHAGKLVIGESHLGFLFADAPQMLRNFQLVDQATRSVDETGSNRGVNGAPCATITTSCRYVRREDEAQEANENRLPGLR